MRCSWFIRIAKSLFCLPFAPWFPTTHPLSYLWPNERTASGGGPWPSFRPSHPRDTDFWGGVPLCRRIIVSIRCLFNLRICLLASSAPSVSQLVCSTSVWKNVRGSNLDPGIGRYINFWGILGGVYSSMFITRKVKLILWNYSIFIIYFILISTEILRVIITIVDI